VVCKDSFTEKAPQVKGNESYAGREGWGEKGREVTNKRGRNLDISGLCLLQWEMGIEIKIRQENIQKEGELKINS